MAKNRLDKRLQNIPSHIWLAVNKIDELKGQWIAGATLGPQILGRLKRSVLITSTGASTRIEGARLSDEDIEKMMRGLSVQKFSDRDVQEVKGYYELLNNVFDSWKTVRINESTIKHFHKELLKYVDKDKGHRGEYKKQENTVHMTNESGESVGVLFDTTPAYLTPKEMQELIDWLDNSLNDNSYHGTVAKYLIVKKRKKPVTNKAPELLLRRFFDGIDVYDQSVLRFFRSPDTLHPWYIMR